MKLEGTWSPGYSTVMASDLTRDGMVLELWFTANSHDDLVAEVFFDDHSHKLILRSFTESTSKELLDKLYAEAEVRLLPGEGEPQPTPDA